VKAGFSNEEFVGYTFAGSPERRPRLWFLDRHIVMLMHSGWTVSGSGTWGDNDPVDIDVGTWTMVDIPRWRLGTDPLVFTGAHLRYEHHSDPPWTAVWRLTDIYIPHVHTFGQDDTWRLGLWPD
jgi:hypothetical protein